MMEREECNLYIVFQAWNLQHRRDAPPLNRLNLNWIFVLKELVAAQSLDHCYMGRPWC